MSLTSYRAAPPRVTFEVPYWGPSILVQPVAAAWVVMCSVVVE